MTIKQRLINNDIA